MSPETTYPGVYVQEVTRGVRSIAGVATSVTAFLGHFGQGATGRALRIASFVDFEREFGGLRPASEASYAVHQFFSNGGSECWVVGADSPDGDSLLRALARFDAVDLVNILCIPDTIRLADGDAAGVIAAAEAYARERRALFLVDLPQRDARRDEVAALSTWLQSNAALRSSNAALYFPRPRVADPLDVSTPRAVATSGTMAGVLARTDAERGVWKAAAGVEAKLRGVVDLEVILGDREVDVLNALAVNCLRSLPKLGVVCWGARTLAGTEAGASDWKYVPVRRLALFIEESLYRGTRWAVFEPNAEPLWARLRISVGAFFEGLFRRGAFEGRTPDEAYFVRCDAGTTTGTDIDRGVVNLLMGFAPLKPAEFVIVRIQLCMESRRTLKGQILPAFSRAILSRYAQRLDSEVDTARRTWPSRVRASLDELVTRARGKEVFGAGSRSARPGARGQGEKALFSGESGTGKTLAARVVARELGRDLYRVDLASLGSKYIGETEKNLARLFEVAEQEGVILLFDEADVLFGKRSKVMDAHDRYANLEVSGVLERLERYPGLAILESNAREDIDEAFLRRVGTPVEFPARERRSKGDAGAFSEEHLREKIEQILFTHPGERVGRPDFGVGLRRMAFEPLDTNRAAVWEDRIRSQLQRWLGEELEVEAVEVGVEGRSGSADIVYRLRLDGRRLRAVFSR